MATYRLEMVVVKRASGRSVVSAVAYQHASRLEQKEGFWAEVDDKGKVGAQHRIEPEAPRAHDYSRKDGVLDSFLYIPKAARGWIHHTERERLWNLAEAAEKRKDASLGRELRLSLPHELSLDDHKLMTRRYAQQLSERYGTAVDIAIHAPSRRGDERNFHAHLMMTTRRLTRDGFGEKTRELDELGAVHVRDAEGRLQYHADGSKVLRDPRGPKEVEWMRARWAEVENAFLVRHGFNQVDHRTLKEQGVDREPKPQLSRHAWAMEKRGIETYQGAMLRAWEKKYFAEQEAAAYKRHLEEKYGAHAVTRFEPWMFVQGNAKAVEEAIAEKTRRQEWRNHLYEEIYPAWRKEAEARAETRLANFLQHRGEEEAKLIQAHERATNQVGIEQSRAADVHEQLMNRMYGAPERALLSRVEEIEGRLAQGGVAGWLDRVSGREQALQAELTSLKAEQAAARVREVQARAQFETEQRERMAALEAKQAAEWQKSQEAFDAAQARFEADQSRRRVLDVEQKAQAYAAAEAEMQRAFEERMRTEYGLSEVYNDRAEVPSSFDAGVERDQDSETGSAPSSSQEKDQDLGFGL